MATETQRERLRADLDADTDALTDPEIDEIFARATEQHGDDLAAVDAAARVLAIQQLMAGAAKRADYGQNASSEKRSQVFDHLTRLRAIYEADLQAALGGAVAYGKLRRKPSRIEEYPDA
ncbi:MAG: hypothetical protein LC121_26320 [Anaerolineae bacterium]|nr:hypothetical protein [Anaerolineae bacterium]